MKKVQSNFKMVKVFKPLPTDETFAEKMQKALEKLNEPGRIKTLKEQLGDGDERN